MRRAMRHGMRCVQCMRPVIRSGHMHATGTGAFWMVMGNNMELTGRDWSALQPYVTRPATVCDPPCNRM